MSVAVSSASAARCCFARHVLWGLVVLAAASLVGCASKPKPAPAPGVEEAPLPTSYSGTASTIVRARSRWVPVDWSELPGVE
ncbi:MAG: hypothetical protein LBP52_08565, partial [Burkholderiaceae bacterium]|nr:hypothetical protein [Burkholderiaceae bacterium]